MPKSAAWSTVSFGTASSKVSTPCSRTQCCRVRSRSTSRCWTRRALQRRMRRSWRGGGRACGRSPRRSVRHLRGDLGLERIGDGEIEAGIGWRRPEPLRHLVTRQVLQVRAGGRPAQTHVVPSSRPDHVRFDARSLVPERRALHRRLPAVVPLREAVVGGRRPGRKGSNHQPRHVESGPQLEDPGRHLRYDTAPGRLRRAISSTMSQPRPTSNQRSRRGRSRRDDRWPRPTSGANRGPLPVGRAPGSVTRDQCEHPRPFLFAKHAGNGEKLVSAQTWPGSGSKPGPKLPTHWFVEKPSAPRSRPWRTSLTIASNSSVEASRVWAASEPMTVVRTGTCPTYMAWLTDTGSVDSRSKYSGRVADQREHLR